MAQRKLKEQPNVPPPKPMPGPKHMKAIFLCLVIFRLVNALTLKTFFQPDEYYQSLEPAILSAFGPDANPWITWEWHEGLRSSIHPLIFASVYKAVDSTVSFLGLDPRVQANALVAAPKVAQALFAAFTDAYTYRFACDVYGSGTSASWAALALTTVSPWMWFASVRTLSNSLETMLTIIAIRLWPWELFLTRRSTPARALGASMRTLYGALCVAALACILRPTNIIIWAAISITIVLRTRDFGNAWRLALAAFYCGSAVLFASIAADKAFYGDYVLPPVQFLRFNVVQSLAAFYGQNRPDYYLTEGIPLLLTTSLPFVAAGIWQAFRPAPNETNSSALQISRRTRSTLVVAILASIAVLSLISHKEVRFIFPLLPMLHILAAKPIATFFNPARRRTGRLVLLTATLMINLVIIYYTAFVHQRGVIDVMHYLRHENEARFELSSETYSPISAAFLMPCHSTPWRSHLIYPEITAWALTCEPPLELSMAERVFYLDEADVFYEDPFAWVEQNMRNHDSVASTHPDQEDGPDKREWPEYFVFFEQLEPVMEEMLHGSVYRECWRGFNTHWHDDWRRKGDVVVLCSSR